jgi:hypothetical protein
MGTSQARLVLVLTCIAVLCLPSSASARTEGPFTAQIVDAETGAPLAGVVVVARYEKKTASSVHPETSFYDLDETVTDAEGRFTVAARSLPISTPLSHVVGPIFIFFKGGYKGWRFQGVEYGEHVDPGVRNELHEEGWRKFKGAGVVIVKHRAKTRDDRTWEMGFARPYPPIPEGRAPLLQKALEEEEIAIRKLR